MTMRHAAGGAGDLDEPKPTDVGTNGEGRLDAGDRPDGTVAPAIKGTSVAGPSGGTVVAVTDGSLGSTVDPDPDRTAHEANEDR